ncbi:hypothetical protein BH11ACT2_BH11ACT2_05840 [soil metagenome]
MRANLLAISACVVALVLSGCSSVGQQALSAAQEAEAALASGSLAWQQHEHNRTLPTVTITTLRDMLAAISGAESTLTELPAGGSRSASRALSAVREADDAVARALAAVTAGGSATGITAQLQAATDDLDLAIRGLR